MGNVTLTAKDASTGDVVNLTTTSAGHLLIDGGAAGGVTEATLLLILAELEAQTVLLQQIAGA